MRSAPTSWRRASRCLEAVTVRAEMSTSIDSRLDPWDAADLTAFVRARLSDPADTSTIGFWDRRSRTFRDVLQRDLFRSAAACGARLVRAGVAAGDPLIIAAPRPEAALVSWFGAVLVGALPAIAAVRPSFDDQETGAARLRRTAQLLGPRTRALVDVSTGAPAAPPDVVAGTVLVDLAELEADAGELPLPPPILRPTHPDDVAYLQLTSGSTGAGRAVAVTHRSLVANINATSCRLQVGPGDRIVSWLPLYHDMGLVGMALQALLTGTDCLLLTPFEFVADPSAWLGAFGTHGATITAAPNFALDRAVERIPSPEGLDLSGCKGLYVGAEPVRPATLRRFAAHFAPVGFKPDMLLPCYGLAEATLAVTIPEVGTTPRLLRVDRAEAAALGEVRARVPGRLWSLPEASVGDLDLVALGEPLAGVEVRLVDEDGREVEGELACGEITASGPTLAAGYWDGGTLQPFGSHLRTGDIGLRHEGQLYVLERTKNIVIHNGENWSAAVLEAVVGDALGVSSDHVMVFEPDVLGRPGELCALVEAPSEATAASLVTRLRPRLDDLPVRIGELVVVRRGALPRTTSGKKQPATARALMANGKLRVLDRAPLSEPVATVIDLDRLEVGDRRVESHVMGVLATWIRARGHDVLVVPHATLAGDLGLDSLDLFEVAVTLEDELGAAIPERDLAAARTVADLIALAAPAEANSAGLPTALAELQDQIPQIFRTVDEQRGRRVRVDGRWVVDFASCNYLGLDLDPEVMDRIGPLVREWGVHPSWTRAVASPRPYVELEAGLAELVGAPGTLVFPTVTLIHQGLLPLLVGRTGALVVDQAAHHSIQEASALARDRGATVRTFRHGDLDALDHLLTRLAPSRRRVVAVDGVYSMSGRTADLPALVEVAERHDAVLYVDDAHGIGVIGAGPTAAMPYGFGGGGVVRHHDVGYERIVYVGGLSKAFSSLAAFVTCRDEAERRVLERASTMIFSGPVPTASLASALAGLEVNARSGDALRQRLLDHTLRLSEGLRELGFAVGPHDSFPIITVTIGHVDSTVRACRALWDRGLLLTPAVFPAAPIDAGGVRLTLTAAHQDADVDQALDAFAELRREPLIARSLAASRDA
ncbi:MAG: aminotransferase class I/II-fold pyridoxal phosphate-dependent enzyme [Acidimicrobiia bacterium]